MKLTLDQISAFIEERYIARGRAYFNASLLDLIEITPDRVIAKCAGTRMYKVTLALKGKTLSGTCTCPAFDEFGPCKHMAATALAVVVKSAQGCAPGKAFVARDAHVSRIERKLMRLSKAELVELIMQLVPDEDELDYFLSDEVD